MPIEEILSLSIVGAIVSFFIEFIKNKFGANSNVVKVITLTVSLVAGGLYYFLSDTAFLVAVFGILGSASIIWGYFLKESDLFVSKGK
jgi:hypothetical protein